MNSAPRRHPEEIAAMMLPDKRQVAARATIQARKRYGHSIITCGDGKLQGIEWLLTLHRNDENNG